MTEHPIPDISDNDDVIKVVLSLGQFSNPAGSVALPPDGSLFFLSCRECDTDPEAPIPFDSAEARGKWAAAHRDSTGHDTWWCHDYTPRETT